jgi:hypothetical protein
MLEAIVDHRWNVWNNLLAEFIIVAKFYNINVHKYGMEWNRVDEICKYDKQYEQYFKYQ